MGTSQPTTDRLRTRLAELGGPPVAPEPEPVDHPAGPRSDAWVAAPEQDDATVQARTGRTWDQWRAVIDGWSGHEQGHAEVARWLQEEHGVEGWWAQSITVGWERITGRRLPGQVADGTFTANRSATITTDASLLGELLRDEDARAWLFPGLEPQLRSRPSSKNVRIALTTGVAEIAIAPRDAGRATITVQHAKLPSPAEATRWKAYWGDWLAAVDDA